MIEGIDMHTAIDTFFKDQDPIRLISAGNKKKTKMEWSKAFQYFLNT